MAKESICKNCGETIFERFIADTEFYGHDEWTHHNNYNTYCSTYKAEPKE